MGKAKVTRKDKAYKLFSEGFEPSSPEVKALGLSESSRYSYHSKWKAEGKPAPSAEQESKEAKEKPTVKAKTVLTDGETIGPISETPPEESKGKEEESKGTEQESKGAEEKPKDEKVGIKEGNDKKPLPGSVIGEGLKATVNLSIKTLALYQYAATHHPELTLGDFLDVCAEDAYQGRGVDLGLVRIGGKNNG